MFDGGELGLVILALTAEKPRYGYEIIKMASASGSGAKLFAQASSIRP